MKRIAFFCIPAHGHINPMTAVAAELVKRGDEVRFYSFAEFREQILAAGAQFIPCDSFLPKLDERKMSGIRNVSVTEMTIEDLRITKNMDSFLAGEMKEFCPDVIYTDSACFWGKLTALKYGIPMVVSTSTFAFNQISSQYMQSSLRETADLVLGLPRVRRELNSLAPFGYRVKSLMSLVESNNDTDTVVYTTRSFQPCAQTFSDRYAFVGPSVFSGVLPQKAKPRQLVYISMGTVLNDRPDFYRACIEGLKGMDADIILSFGTQMDLKELGELPGNVRAYPSVDQLDVLSRADVFLTHCGMNSVSESLYMAVPMVLYPQTNEERAVARRAEEIGAGMRLRKDTAAGIADAVRKVLQNPAYAEAAADFSRQFRRSPGAAGAAAFIEQAPHAEAAKTDVMKEINRKTVLCGIAYWSAAGLITVLVSTLIGHGAGWIPGIALGLCYGPFRSRVTARTLKDI